MIGKKRLALAAGSVTAAGAVATLVAGTTFGLFSASQTSGDNTFSVGSVSLGTPVDVPCSVEDMVPGDASVGYDNPDAANNQATKEASCTFTVAYSGSVPAFIGLSTDLTGTLGSALDWQIKDQDDNLYTNAGDINTNSATDQLYVATDPGGAGPDNSYTFSVDFALPLSEDDQSLTDATLNLTVSAVQAGNNGDDSTCVAGSQCPGITAWS